MSQTGTPTEFLKLGITEPDDTLNVLVDLNGQWQKIDTGVKNVDTKANTNASGISALNTAVQDNTENITNILETNVNQQTSIDTLQSKVATLEEDDTSYGTRITAVEAGVQENSELINDLEVDLSGVKTSVGTVPSGSNLQGEVNGLDTRVTALENSGSVAAVEARVTTLETEVGTVPAGETVQGQITTLNGQVNSGNIPFRFSVNGEGTYGYLKADDSFVPFRSGSGDSHWHELDNTLYDIGFNASHVVKYKTYPSTGKLHDLVHDVDYTVSQPHDWDSCIGNVIFTHNNGSYLIKNGVLTPIDGTVVGIIFDTNTRYTFYLTRNSNTFQHRVVNVDGNYVGLPVNFTLQGTPTSFISYYSSSLYYRYNNKSHGVIFDIYNGTSTENDDGTNVASRMYSISSSITFHNWFSYSTGNMNTPSNNVVYFIVNESNPFFVYRHSKYFYYI